MNQYLSPDLPNYLNGKQDKDESRDNMARSGTLSRQGSSLSKRKGKHDKTSNK